MKILVCGSRDWTSVEIIERELMKLPPKSILVHGACAGADRIAGSVGRALGFTVRVYPADWSLGKGAGLVRNRAMLAREHLPDAPIDKVFAFAENFSVARGTVDMLRLAFAADILIARISE